MAPNKESINLKKIFFGLALLHEEDNHIHKSKGVARQTLVGDATLVSVLLWKNELARGKVT